MSQAQRLQEHEELSVGDLAAVRCAGHLQQRLLEDCDGFLLAGRASTVADAIAGGVGGFVALGVLAVLALAKASPAS